MVKKFQGKVTIESIQTAFDSLVDRINNMVDAYNDSASVQDIDFSKGGTTLAPSGYTLTIGGLKQLMRYYDGSVIGCKVFRCPNNRIKVTTGIIITRDAIYRTPETLMSGSAANGTQLFYDPDTDKIKFPTGSAQVTYRNFTIPVFSNNSTWGAVSATGYSSDAWKALDGVNGNEHSLWWFYRTRNHQGSSGTATETLSFVFKQTLRCKSINIATSDKRVFALDKVEILDLSGKVIASRNTPNSNATYTINLGNKVLQGIKVRCYKTSWSLLGGALPEFTLVAQEQVVTASSSGEDMSNWIKIADLNWNRDIDYLNCITKVQSEGTSDITIRTESKAPDVRANDILDTSDEGKFVCGMEWDRSEGQTTAHTYLLGREVAWNRQTGHKNRNYWSPLNFLFVPKGVPMPYTQDVCPGNKVYKLTES